jgi:hypothetical protein
LREAQREINLINTIGFDIQDCFPSPHALLGALAHRNDIFWAFYEVIKWGWVQCNESKVKMFMDPDDSSLAAYLD